MEHPYCTDLEQFRFQSDFARYLLLNTFIYRHFDNEHRKIYSGDLVKIYNTTKCKKPCTYKKYSLVGEKQPVQFENGQFLFSLAAMQDSTEV